MIVEHLEQQTIACLRAAGWEPGRRLDVRSFVEVLAGDGYAVFPPVEEFVAAFGNLTISFPHYRDPTIIDHCHFDVAQAVRNVFPENVSYWSDRVGDPLCPIGEAFSNHMTLLIADDGAMYGGFEETLVKLGDNGDEALNNLCGGREPEFLGDE